MYISQIKHLMAKTDMKNQAKDEFFLKNPSDVIRLLAKMKNW